MGERLHPHQKQIRVFDWVKFSQHCKVAIEALNLTQAKVARECHISPQRVNHLVRRQKSCCIDTVLKLCIYLQLDPIAYCVPYYKWDRVVETGEVKAR